MSWKKNLFSYPIWLVYTLITGIVLVCLAGLYCQEAGLSGYLGIPFAALYALCVGGISFLIHRFRFRAASLVEKQPGLLAVLEAACVVVLLAVGVVLRVRGVAGAGQAAAYYETARVAMGQEIPRIVHGAVYFYLLALRGIFTLFGNHFMAGIWFQIVLQLAAFFGLFFVIRKLSGPIAALITLGLCVCSPYMVQHALTMSPEMLYFAFLTMGVGLVCAGQSRKLRPALFLPLGVLAALCCYIDVIGVLLLYLALAVVFCVRDEMPGIGRKAAAISLCVSGFLAGFAGCVFADAYLSGATFRDVLRIWFLLYQPEGFLLPVTMDGVGASWEISALVGLMAFGIFGFWCHRKEERLGVGTVAVCSVMPASGFGIFTDEMPGFFYLYLLFIILAGVGVEECFRVAAGEKAGGEADGTDRMPEEAEGVEMTGTADMAEGAETVEYVEESTVAETSENPGKRDAVQFIENPLPLPKKSKKKALEYALELISDEDDFDYPVPEDDDFDI